MNPAACRLLTPVAVAGTWYRAVRPRHFATALAYGHSVTTPTRSNPGAQGRRVGFAVLYLADHPQTCLLEVGALLSPPGGPVVGNPAAGAWTVFPVQVRLNRVADLCDPTQLALLGTSVQELTGDWRGYARRAPAGHAPMAPTQRPGTVPHRRRVEGLLTYSARDTVRRNLVVFPTRMRPASRVELSDPATGGAVALGRGGAVVP